jgi:hypothetical protein
VSSRRAVVDPRCAVMLPRQWRQNEPESPERALACAVLMTVLEDLTGTPRWGCAPGVLRREALDWLAEPDDTPRLFAFGNVCRLLNLDPATVRAALLARPRAATRRARASRLDGSPPPPLDGSADRAGDAALAALDPALPQGADLAAPVVG